MSTKNIREALIDQVAALYGRLHAGELKSSDMITLEEINLTIMEDYAEVIYNDPVKFKHALPNFMDVYDIFRVFDDDVLVLDVGAHWGYSAIAMRHQGCRAKIISIEAMSINIPSLDRLKQIDQGRYGYIHMAAGAEVGELTFYVPTINGFANAGLASTGATLDDYFAFLIADLAQTYPSVRSDGSHDIRLLKTKVASSPIDHILDNNFIDGKRVAAIKLDVEGHEGPALRGAEELFRVHKPLLMLENANRDPASVCVMLSHDYFHCERREGQLFSHAEFSYENDGFWVSRDKVEEYCSLGIFKGSVPTVEEAARTIENKWNSKSGFSPESNELKTGRSK